MEIDQLMTRRDLAQRLGKHPKTLISWQKAKYGPPVVYVGQTPMYRVESVDKWIRDQEGEGAK